MEAIEGFIKHISGIGNLDEQEVRLLKSGIKHHHFKKNQIIIGNEKPCASFYFLIKGAIRMYRILDGRDVTLNIFTRSRFFTDFVSIKNNSPSECKFETILPSEVIELSANHVQSLYRNSLKFDRIGRIMHEEILYDEILRLQDVMITDAEKRYQTLVAKNPDIMRLVPQKYIASYLGIKPESLSRLRKKLTP